MFIMIGETRRLVLLIIGLLTAVSITAAQQTAMAGRLHAFGQKEDNIEKQLFYHPNRNIIQETDSSSMARRHPVYIDLASMVSMTNISINMEQPLGEQIFFRIGLGRGWEGLGGSTSAGLLTMINYISGIGNNHFDVGAGFSFIKISDKSSSDILPAMAAGYRYQSGEFIARLGLGYTFRFGTPVYLSIGAML